MTETAKLTHAAVFAKLESLASPDKAASSAWFFKTGPGQYGEGDLFMGITVPEQRKVARKFRQLPLDETLTLLASPYHEARLTALFILVQQFEKGDETTRKSIYDAYLSHRATINNWDLVDSSAAHIVGAWLLNKPKAPLFKLARSKRMWDRRIAMIATFADIRRGEPAVALELAELLLNDPEDLMQKAVGWMLREVGKRCDRALLENFLQHHHKTMPRTTLRYAIEHFPADQRQRYLKGF